MIGISFHSGGLADKPLAWVIEHLSSVGYDAIEIVCGRSARSNSTPKYVRRAPNGSSNRAGRP